MRTLRAYYDGQVLVPDGPVDLPTGCLVEIQLTPLSEIAEADTPLSRLAELMSQFPENPDAPSDLASQHDHYLYGTPRRS